MENLSWPSKKKLHKQNNFARTSWFSVNFFGVLIQLRREMTKFQVLFSFENVNGKAINVSYALILLNLSELGRGPFPLSPS